MVKAACPDPVRRVTAKRLYEIEPYREDKVSFVCFTVTLFFVAYSFSICEYTWAWGER